MVQSGKLMPATVIQSQIIDNSMSCQFTPPNAP